MKIAAIQMNSIPADFAQTRARMLTFARQAQARGAELAVYCACTLSGAYPAGLVAYDAYQRNLIQTLCDFAAATPLACVVPAYIDDGVAPYMELFLCEEGTVCPIRRRYAHISSLEFPCAAAAPGILSFRGLNLVFSLDAGELAPADMSCDVEIVISLTPYCWADPATLGVRGLGQGTPDDYLVSRPVPQVLYVQSVGAYDDLVFAGGSYALSGDDRLMAQAALFAEDIIVADFEGLHAGHAGDEPSDGGNTDGQAAGAAISHPEYTERKELGDEELSAYLWDALVLAVRDYVQKSGFSDVVVGLSGGIDSAVVCVLACDALGADHVHAIRMPGPFSSPSSLFDAQALADNLGIETYTVPINDMFEVSLAALTRAQGHTYEGTGRENLQARLRGLIVMSLANSRNALVLNTGNKSEAAMGYSTLYGDTVGAYAPLSDVYKTRVFKLARQRNKRAGYDLIPDSILTKPPSAELSEGQTDEASFGAAYDEVDHIVSLHVDQAFDASDIIRDGCNARLTKKILKTCKQAEFKRRQEPMGPAVSIRSFDERSWPVVNGWDMCLEEDLDASDPDDYCIADVLDAMIAAQEQNTQPFAAAMDMTLGNLLSGRGPDTDTYFGFSVFSNN